MTDSPAASEPAEVPEEADHPEVLVGGADLEAARGGTVILTEK